MKSEHKEQMKEYEQRLLALPDSHHAIYKTVEHVRAMVRRKESEALDSDLHLHEVDMKTVHWFADEIVTGLVEDVLKNTIEDLEHRYEKIQKHFVDGVE